MPHEVRSNYARFARLAAKTPARPLGYTDADGDGDATPATAPVKSVKKKRQPRGKHAGQA